MACMTLEDVSKENQIWALRAEHDDLCRTLAHTVAEVGKLKRELADTYNLAVDLRSQRDELAAALEDAEWLLRKVGLNWKEAGSMKDSCLRCAGDAHDALAKLEKRTKQ